MRITIGDMKNKTAVKKTYIGKSKIKGEGLFSAGHIAEGEHIFTVLGKPIQHQYSKDFAMEGSNWVGSTLNEWIAPEPQNPIHSINHSCNPNCFINETFAVIAFKPIHAHEELLIDYSTTEIDPYWQMDCNCGEKNCRKVLKSFQYLPFELQFKYRKFIPDRLYKFIPRVH
jgi:uncharacterized protein